MWVEKMSWKLVLPILLIIIGIAAWVQTRPRIPPQPADRAELESALDALVARGSAPGLSVVVLKDQSQVYNAAFGWADGPAQVPASPETIYHWWSLTKMATALAVLQLHDEGRLKLDDPVDAYLPYFEVTLDGEPAPPITIRQLLRHTSGLPDTIPAMIGWVHYEDEIYNQTALVRKHLPDYSELRFAPDSDAAYSNLGYMVLGAVIEAATGQAYEIHVVEAVLQPLGMNQSGFLYNGGMRPNSAAGSHPLASAYTPMLPFLLDLRQLVRERAGGRLWFNPVYLDVTPSSGLLGPANEAAWLAQALVQRQEMLPEWGSTLPAHRPLGWAEYSDEGRHWVQHQGGGPGFATLMRLYPEEDLVVVLMSNTTHLPSVKIADAVAALDW